MNDSARPKRSDSAMGNGFDMELESKKKEKLKTNNKMLVTSSGEEEERACRIFNHSFYTYMYIND
jgi:hypothetical protein